MSVKVTFECSGCMEAKAEGTGSLRNDRFKNAKPAGYVNGTAMVRTVDESLAAVIERVTPEGWIAFDPWTSCTYCPDCWASIQGAVEETDQTEGEKP